MRIHLHLGVHKTATTALQSQLAGAAASMRAAGIGYLPLPMLRSRFTHALAQMAPGQLSDDRALQEFFFGDQVPSEVRGILISDENLLGSCGPLLRTGRLYPTMHQKLAHLRAVLEGHELQVFVSIRSFDRFLASAYCEGLLAIKEFVPFAKFRALLGSAQPASWLSLLDTVSQALSPVSTHVWRYEDLDGHVDEVLQRLAFDLPIEPTRTLAAERASFSHVAIAFLEHANKAFGPTQTAQLFKGMDAIAPKRAGYAAFHPWSAAETQNFADRYALEVSRIPEALWLIAPNDGEAAADAAVAGEERA